MLTGVYYGKYKKTSESTGQRVSVFKYAVSGNETELSRYREVLGSQGLPCHIEEYDEIYKGRMIYFTTVHHGDTVDIQISKNNTIYVENKKALKLESQLQQIKDPLLKITMVQKVADVMFNNYPPEKVEELETNFEAIFKLEPALFRIKDPLLREGMRKKINDLILGLPVTFSESTMVIEEQKSDKSEITTPKDSSQRNKRKEQIWTAIGAIIVGSLILFFVVPQLAHLISSFAVVIALVIVVWVYLEVKK